MQAEIISIGDELLIGQTVNTNASWMGKEFSSLGISVARCTTISDNSSEILEAIDQALNRSKLVLMTGGLGPTKDDITKHTLCTYFNTYLEINEKVLERVTKYFTDRGRGMLEVNIQQAALPFGCTVLDNLQGTASGMWFEKNGSILVSLPGVPFEMKSIMENEVFPKLKEYFNVSSIFHRTILLQGIGESFLADKMEDWENRIRFDGFGLAYLPSVGAVKLRITSPNGEVDLPKIERYFTEITEALPVNVYGRGEETLSEVVGKLLLDRGLTIGTVESCTAGAVATAIVSTAGATTYFKGSFLTYSNELKNKIVDVNQADLDQFGAVSETVVRQMAENGRNKLGVDYCISTSGIAGPDGGSEEKPVGTIYIGIATKEGSFSVKYLFGNHRDRNVQMAVLSALNLLRCSVLGIILKK